MEAVRFLGSVRVVSGGVRFVFGGVRFVFGGVRFVFRGVRIVFGCVCFVFGDVRFVLVVCALFPDAYTLSLERALCIWRRTHPLSRSPYPEAQP